MAQPAMPAPLPQATAEPSVISAATGGPPTLYGPYDVSALTGNRVVLSAPAQSSTPVWYQWYFNDGLVAASSSSLLILPAVAATNAGAYFVVASNRYGMVTSRVATVTVTDKAPGCSIQLLGWWQSSGNSAVVYAGQQIKLIANAAGGPPPTLQWRVNGADLPGETNSFIFFPSVPPQAGGEYRVAASNPLGAATSAPVRLDVVAQAPLFVWVSESKQVEGSVVALRSGAAGGPEPSYQWRRDGVDLPGETNLVLLLPCAKLEDAGYYEVVASNSEGQARATNTLAIRPATGLDHWQWRAPLATGSRLYSVAWGNGRYVAVGKVGNIVTSTDGLHWTNVLMAVDFDFTQVVFGNGVFVAGNYWYYDPVRWLTNVGASYGTMSAGVLFTSTDGLNWTLTPAPGGLPVTSLAYGNGKFIASGSDQAFIYTSLDGRHWTPQVWQWLRAESVGYAGGRFFAACEYDLYSSTDGAQWSPQGWFYLWVNAASLAFGQNRFVSSALWEGVSYVSDDGLTWHDSTLCWPYNYLKAIAAGPNRFVAVPNDPSLTLLGTLLVSQDGVDWQEVDTGTGQELEGVIYANGAFMAVGEAGAIVTSPDGLTWTAVPMDWTDYWGLVSVGGVALAAGDNGTILASTNGQTWTACHTPNRRDLHAIHYANGLYVAGGKKGALITSPDGVNWTARTSGLTNYIARIHWADGRWVAVADSGGIATSTNGLDWSSNNTGGAYGSANVTDHEGLAYGNGLWVAVGGYSGSVPWPCQGGACWGAVGTIYASSNGLQWTSQPLQLGVRLRDVTFGGGRFLAVGNDGAMLLSTNGSNWISIGTWWGGSPGSAAGNNALNWRRAFYSQGQFFTVGNNGFMASSATPEAANSWIHHRSHTSENLHDICALADSTFLALGNNGMILQSGPTRPAFASARLAGSNLAVEIDPQLAEGRLAVEATTDFHHWQTIATNVGRHAELPRDSKTAWFFRLTIPQK